LIAALRRRDEAGIPIVADYGDAKLERQLKRADRANVRAAIILGDDELAAGVLGLRDLMARVQVKLPAALDDPDATAVDVLRWYGELRPASAILEAV
jgi:histidyl-tRNA synthetase